ncbi:MAG: ATP synthase F1 subunit delta, partial [Actinobacteria bacterium]|nr:ATP synthase F1 subunit delta [Actinomycetota bacterium]
MTRDSASTGYAKAIFEIARSEGALERVADELFRIARTLESEHQLRQTLTDIALPAEGKEKLIDDLLKEKASPHTLNVLKFVVGAGKARDLVDIADELARLAEEESNREIAEVRTAVELDDATKQRLQKALVAATGKNVSMKVIVDPKVLGGVFARVGDVVIDGTVRHKLESLREHL